MLPKHQPACYDLAMDTGNDLISRIDRAALGALRAREEAAFAARTPKSRTWLAAARSSMPNGVPVAWMAGLYRHNTIVAPGGEGAHEAADIARYVTLADAFLAEIVR